MFQFRPATHGKVFIRRKIFRIRGVQYVHWVMHKCIMVKLGGKRNTRTSQASQVKLLESRRRQDQHVFDSSNIGFSNLTGQGLHDNNSLQVSRLWHFIHRHFVRPTFRLLLRFSQAYRILTNPCSSSAQHYFHQFIFYLHYDYFITPSSYITLIIQQILSKNSSLESSFYLSQNILFSSIQHLFRKNSLHW